MLPRRLAPVLPSPYSRSFLHSVKAHVVHAHLGFPRHAYAHCEGFATAALRRAWTFVSVSISRLPLSWPVRIVANPPQTHPGAMNRIQVFSFERLTFQCKPPMGFCPQFPEVIPLPRVDCPRVTELDARTLTVSETCMS